MTPDSDDDTVKDGERVKVPAHTPDSDDDTVKDGERVKITYTPRSDDTIDDDDNDDSDTESSDSSEDDADNTVVPIDSGISR